ncbi:uncharacterized protein [Antedon mediterranea]|uniref:uncharacterized protein n=1 Tax=Antedon mediterranea TaxID=105859 RepID=UPI003AF457DB
MWIVGPEILRTCRAAEGDMMGFDVELLANDPEVYPEAAVSCKKTVIPSRGLGNHRFSRFSSWKVIKRAISNLKGVAKSWKNNSSRKDKQVKSPRDLQEAETTILRSLQSETFSKEIEEVKKEKLSKNNKLIALQPYLDQKGILRVGGRLKHAQLSERATNPIILPKNNHITDLVIKHLHQQCNHQGRHITLGRLRSEGYWVLGGHKQVAKVIQGCVTCRRLRGKHETQIMANLPFQISRGKTRASCQAKRWAVMFTCMYTRGVHIEVLESMDSSSFINALRRFFAIRGPAKQIRSDCGTNFVGACSKLGHELHDKNTVKRFLLDHGCEWIFNPPHASHMGGAWERMIGIARRILDGVMRDVKPSQITHEVFVTLMAEVAATINSRDHFCQIVIFPSCH